ncbi:hypothetical protein [Lactiplantibacillus paraxiangfangensis]
MERMKRLISAVVDRFKVAVVIIAFVAALILLAKVAALWYYTALF